MIIDNRKKITDLFEGAGEYLRNKRRLVSDYEIFQGSHVHAYYNLILNNETLHVEAYPGLSDEKEIMIDARVKNLDKLIECRRKGDNIGSEHRALVRDFKHARSGLLLPLPYSQVALEGVLSSYIFEHFLDLFTSKVVEMGPNLKDIQKILQEARI